MRRCGDCDFFYEENDECRRHAPRRGRYHPGLDAHNSELLRDIAWSARTMANIEEPSLGDDMRNEPEIYRSDWPHVTENDWCGEFVKRVEEASDDSSTSSDSDR